MTFFRPTITKTSQAYATAALNAINSEFVIGPYDFSKSNFTNSQYCTINNLDAVILFDLPSEITVYINDISIPGTIFDYYNPLLLNARILERIEFVNQQTSEILQNFKCYNLTSKILNSYLTNIMNTIIYYPPGFTIDYKNIIAQRSVSGRQICDFMSKIGKPLSQGLPFPAAIPVPLRRSFPQNNSRVILGPQHTTQLYSVNPMELFMSLIGNALNNNNNDNDDDDEIPSLFEPNSISNSHSNQPEDGQNF